MSETARMADQVRRSVWGEAWHGPGIHAVLEQITAEQAVAYPLSDGHSIWEIVLHITAWIEAVHKRVDGEPIRLEGDHDWPPVHDTSEDAWTKACAALVKSHEQFADRVEQLDDDRLDDRITGEPPEIYCQVHGIVQHSLYHTGQIVLLKKLLK